MLPDQDPNQKSPPFGGLCCLIFVVNSPFAAGVSFLEFRYYPAFDPAIVHVVVLGAPIIDFAK